MSDLMDIIKDHYKHIDTPKKELPAKGGNTSIKKRDTAQKVEADQELKQESGRDSNAVQVAIQINVNY